MGLRHVLLGGASVAALSVGMPAPNAHGAPPPLSPAWFAARNAQNAAGGGQRGGGGSVPTFGNGTGLSPQAMQQAQKSVANLTLAARSIVAAQQRQAQAQAAALATPKQVPDGLGAGGLLPVAGATPGSPSWMGANLPTQAANAGRTVVTVKQTAAQAALTWQSFNVGQNTTLSFDQSAGGSVASTWSVVNRLASTSTAPSQILGAITAPGQVYVINRNGIIFGGGSQINVGALVASTADINQTQFQTTGLFSQLAGSTFIPSFTGATADSAVIVEPGASITTNAPQSTVQGGGFVLMMGGQVENDGVISTPNGQVALAAGQDFVLQPGFSQSSTGATGTTGNTQATTLGIEVAVADGGGPVTNTGILQSTTGDITMVGHKVTQAGIAVTTTSVAQRGTIHLLTDTSDTTASVTLAPGSVTLIDPDDGGATPALDVSRNNAYAASAVANVLRQSQALNNQSLLPDAQNESRVEITAGGSVSVQGGALIDAPAGQVAVATGKPGAYTGSVLVDNQAVIDVAGLQNVSLPMSANQVLINIQGFEQQDAPVNRNSKLLNNDNVWVYIPSLVANASELFTAGGLLQVTGEVGNIGHTIQEFSTIGGTVALSSGNVVTQPGSLINVAGGSIAYQPGFIQNSYVIATNGFIYNVNTAPANLLYTGVYGGFTENHPHWGISTTFNSGIVHPTQTFVSGYTVGMDAGTVLIDAPSVSLQGAIDASVTPGPTQTQLPSASVSTSPVPSALISAAQAGEDAGTLANLVGAIDPFQQPQDVTPIGGTLLIGSYNAFSLLGAGPDTAEITGAAPAATLPPVLSSDFAVSPESTAEAAAAAKAAAAIAALPAAQQPKHAAEISASVLADSGLASLSIAASQTLTVAAPLTLAPAGQITLAAAHVAVNAPITASGATLTAGNFIPQVASGSVPPPPITLTYVDPNAIDPSAPSTEPPPPNASVTVAPGVAIDVSGQFTNAWLAPEDSAAEAFVNGGNVTLQSSGPVTLGAGSLIDTASGAAITASGGTLGGSGGNITLAAAFPNGTDPLTLGGTLNGVGVKNGGVLALQAPAVVIGTPRTAPVKGELVLQPSFFQQGFSSYDITGYGTLTSKTGTDSNSDDAGKPLPGVEVTPGTVVTAVVPTYEFTNATKFAPTGTPVAQALQEVLFPTYLANPVTGAVTQRPGASIALSSAYGASLTENLPSVLPFAPALSIFQNTTDQLARGGGSVVIGKGAVVQVDPGSQILVQGFNQVTVNGTLSAPSGSIAVLNDRVEDGFNPPQFVEGQSVLIGPDAVLNVAAQAFVAQDLQGRPFGVVPAGGAITLGGAGGVSFGSGASMVSVPTQSVGGELVSTDSVVIVSPGAVADASGASAMIDPLAGTTSGKGKLRLATDPTLATGPTLVASDGGKIALNSDAGIFLEGTLRAAAGGRGAAGGTLSLMLETPSFQGNIGSLATSIPEALRVPHEIVISETAPSNPLPDDLKPGDPTPFLDNPSLIGQAALSAQQFAAGGFDNLTLFTRDLLLFNGNVTLNAGQSISLTAGEIANTSTTGQVNVAAPYLLVAGTQTVLPTDVAVAVVLTTTSISQSPAVGQPFPTTQLPCLTGAGGDCSDGTLTFSADLLQLQGSIRFGISSTITLLPPTSNSNSSSKAPTSLAVNEPGFNNVNFNSTGDVQFLPGASGGATDITSAGNLTFTAAQLDPVGGATASIFAGVNPLANSPQQQQKQPIAGLLYEYFANGALTINGNGTDPAPPLTAGGSLTFGAANILQGGIIRAPLGSITFGAPVGNTAQLLGTPAVKSLPDAELVYQAQQITLLPGSITSVSAAGETIPYGGTSDGVTFTAVNGQSPTSANPGAFTPGVITVTGQSFTVQNGAVLDLSGGGTLAGEGFVSGQGGSANTLVTPLVSFDPSSGTVTAPSLQTPGNTGSKTVPIYAIIPGFGPYAPAATSYPFGGASVPVSAPGVGAQVMLTSSVPGLPAGTYTLLPSFYALLPGAYRIELDNATPRLLSGPNALLNGSYQVNAMTSVANTGIRSALPVVATVTSGPVLRTYSQYDEENFSQFLTAAAAQTDGASPALPQDGGTLSLGFFPVAQPVNFSAKAQTQTQTANQTVSAFTFDGTALFQPAPGGVAGGVNMSAGLPQGQGTAPLELTASNVPTPGFTGVSVEASQLNALNAGSITVGGVLTMNNNGNNTGEVIVDNGAAGTISGAILRDGAELRAPQVVLIGPIVLEAGSVIDTVGAGPAPIRPGIQPVYSNQVAGSESSFTAVLAVSNGNLQFQPTQGGDTISFGVCDSNPGCSPSDVARIDSGGSIVFATAGAVTISPTVRIGSAAVTFDVANVNIGSDAALATANVPTGLPFSQTLLSNLLAGDPGSGAPPLQTLTLQASQSVNFLGTVSLDTINPQTGQSSFGELVLSTPAVYGYGGPGDVATLDVGTLVWSGLTTSAFGGENNTVISAVAAPPVTANGPGTGSGTLDINAQQVVFGYSGGVVAQNQVAQQHTILGFSNVDITASQSVSTTFNNTLAVHQAQGPYQNGTGFTYTGGALSITTPLLTAGPGAILAVTAGGAVAVQAPPGGPGAIAPAGLGGEIDLTGASVSLDTAISLPGGKLTAAATGGDVVLGPQATIDLAGRLTGMFDQTAANPGGTLILSSATGNVSMAPSSTIDVSAPGADAGSITASAAQGVVALDGTLSGTAAAGDLGGALAVTAGSMTQDAFDALNISLNNGGFFSARSFDIKAGDLVLGANPAAAVQARSVTVSLDAGNLTVAGPVNASGALPGTISLSASGALTVAASGVLDAHSTVLQVDSSGAPIDASNRAEVDLTSSAGVVTLAPGATIDVSDADGVARGVVNLNVPRAGDVGIAASGPVTILGASSIALNAFRTYLPGDEGLLTGGTITQADINAIGADNTAFINAALGDAGLLNRIAGLTSYGAAFHLRPGVEIDSSAASGGNLVVSGDIDLSGLRTNGLVAANAITSVVGSGEPGVLVLRAADNLDIFGSITDGFGTPPATPDDNGWTLTGGTPLPANVIVTAPLAIRGAALGSRFGNSGTLTYDLPIQPASAAAPLQLVPGATVPVVPSGSAPVTLAAAATVPNSFLATGTITLPNGSVIGAGQTVPAGTVLPKGTVLGAGLTVPVPVSIAALTWPAGANLSAFSGPVSLAKNITLEPGDLIPAGTILRPLAGNTVQTRPEVTNAAGDQVQGLIYAVAPMLPAGDQSWSIKLVSGADLGAANNAAVQPAIALAAQASAADPTPGSILLNDPHTGDPANAAESKIPIPSVIRTGTGSLALVAGGNISQNSLYGIYTAGQQSADVSDADNLPLPNQPGTNSVLGAGGNISANGATYNSAVAGYQAYYPTNGGDVLISAQGTVGGYVTSQATDSIGNWLFRQGGDGTSAAYWINFGTYVAQNSGGAKFAQFTGFTGIGALGGGNVTIASGGDIGATGTFTNINTVTSTSALDVAVASTARVRADGSVEQTGGGALTLTAGGALNPLYFGDGGTATTLFSSSLNSALFNPTLFGTVTDMRGPLTIQAGSIGTIATKVSFGPSIGVAPLDVTQGAAYGGPLLGLGDSAATLTARADLVLTGVIDPTRVAQPELAQDISIGGQTTPITAPVQSWFTLWTPATSIALLSAGGNVAPITANTNASGGGTIADAGRFVYPPSLFVTAEQGNIFLESQTLEVAPAANGQVAMLAGQSIIGGNVDITGKAPANGVVDISGADPATLPTLLNPAYTNGVVTNTPSASVVGADPEAGELFALAPDTPTTNLHAGDPTSALFYAVAGNIAYLTTGQEITFSFPGQASTVAPIFIAAKPVRLEAGRDILNLGGAPGGQTVSPQNSVGPIGERTEKVFGSLILNTRPTDISLISAGQDIFEANVQVAGPGNLIVQAGRNLDQEDQGSLESIGPLVNVNALSRSGGASITAIVGAGTAGPDYTDFANLYLNPANQANPAIPLQSQPGKVVQTYQDQLLAFLQTNEGYTGDASGALAFFKALPPQAQAVFLLPIFYNELNQSGLEETDPTSRFFKSYIRGNEAIAALLPQAGKGDAGSLTMFGASHIATDFGGDVNLLVPGGETTLGVATNPPPGKEAGLLTQGSGDINIFSQSSVELGQSRIFTTFGGGILIWVGDGDIAAGEGSKTTVVSTPINETEDNYGNISLSPVVPSTGAGIATLAPIPSVPPGDVNLIAPNGVIDAGEAGIRSSGNANLAALAVVNAANVQAQGHVTGLPVVAVPNVAALTSAGNASGGAMQAALAAQNAARAQQPSTITVEVVGYGGGDSGGE